MTIIANPIYDVVFKFLMEDQKVAKLLLSALLQKEILFLEMHPHEYTSAEKARISLFRVDFSARVRDEDGSERLILIELQKTWLITETLRFRQYLGAQYLRKENMIVEREENIDKETGFGVPIVSIYILGHPLADLTEPVIYIKRNYQDYDGKILAGPDRFIESLTHDSIIVQIPFLKGHTRNRLEDLLRVFDQDYCLKDTHFMEVDEEQFPAEVQYLVNRLLRAAATPEVRYEMQIEDEILSEIEARDTSIMRRDRIIEQKDQVIEQKEQVIEQKDQVIEQKEQVIEQKEQVIEQKEQVIEQKEQQLEQSKQMLRTMVNMLCQNGMALDAIAEQLSIPLAEVQRLLNSYSQK